MGLLGKVTVAITTPIVLSQFSVFRAGELSAVNSSWRITENIWFPNGKVVVKVPHTENCVQLAAVFVW